MSVLQAIYFDGRTSARHPVSLVLSAGTIKMIGHEVEAELDASSVRWSARIANTPRWLYLPDGGTCVTEDNDAVDRMTGIGRYERILHRWESRPAYAVVAIALVVASLWLLVTHVVPVVVEKIAMRIPVETESVLGRQTLSGMDEYLLGPSQLAESRQVTLSSKFEDMVRASRETTPYRLEFRSSPSLGANAFALPGGIIVMTDQLVNTAGDDAEVLGVLAHELGHVRHRHTMRRLLEGSVIALIIAAVTGDVTSATSLAAAAPTLLLQLKYSRDNEREADQYAIRMMRDSGYDPSRFAALLKRIEGSAQKGYGSVPGFLSSHPPTEEREALAREP